MYIEPFPIGGFPGGSDGKESACSAGDQDVIPGLGVGRFPGEGNGYPLQYSCPVESHGQRSLVDYSPWGHKQLDMTKQLTLSLVTQIVNLHNVRESTPIFLSMQFKILFTCILHKASLMAQQ